MRVTTTITNHLLTSDEKLVSDVHTYTAVASLYLRDSDPCHSHKHAMKKIDEKDAALLYPL